MLKFSLITLIPLLLWGCASNPAMKKEQLSAFAEGNKALVLMDFIGDRNCHLGTFHLTNTATGKSYKISPNAYSRAGQTVLDPGTYQLLAGSCTGNNYQTSAIFRDLSTWFKPFRVGAGEVINLGILEFDVVEGKSAATKGFDKLNNLLTSYTTKDKSNFFTYAFYNGAKSQTVTELLEKSDSILLSKLVNRSPEARIDKSNYELWVNQAHALKADGSRPTTEEARQKLDELIRENLGAGYSLKIKEKPKLSDIF